MTERLAPYGEKQKRTYGDRFKYLGECIWCKQPVFDAREASGATKLDPATDDGDFGCDAHPLSGEGGVWSHCAPGQARAAVLAHDRSYLENNQPRCTQCGGLPHDRATDNFTEDGKPCPECLARGRHVRIDPIYLLRRALTGYVERQEQAAVTPEALQESPEHQAARRALRLSAPKETRA